MKIIIVLLGMLISHQVVAGCEASILEGGHTALTEQDAIAGALEDARDVCYPGDAAPLEVSCDTVSGKQGIAGEPAVKCVQKVSCTLCGEDLQRKYEARND
jgi:hypothetical protein